MSKSRVPPRPGGASGNEPHPARRGDDEPTLPADFQRPPDATAFAGKEDPEERTTIQRRPSKKPARKKAVVPAAPEIAEDGSLTLPPAVPPSEAAQPSAPPPGTAVAQPRRTGVLAALDAALPAGSAFSDLPASSGPQLGAAVEQAQRELAHVVGIQQVRVGRNDQGQPVVLIEAGQGFAQDSLEAVPAQVGGVSTLVVLPFEALPLKRKRSG